jgi:hypothetical protein
MQMLSKRILSLSLRLTGEMPAIFSKAAPAWNHKFYHAPL